LRDELRRIEETTPASGHNDSSVLSGTAAAALGGGVDDSTSSGHHAHPVALAAGAPAEMILAPRSALSSTAVQNFSFTASMNVSTRSR
jgi:hypothetical protein